MWGVVYLVNVLSLQTSLSILLAVLVLVLPGTALYLALSRATREGGNVALTEAALFGIGLSVAFWPLLLLYTSLLGLRFTPPLVWAALVLSFTVIIWQVVPLAKTFRPVSVALLTGGALAGMSLLAFVFRLGDIQGLPVPMFGDSLHHTMVTTIIAGTGRVPTGYQPYAPVDTFTYHF